MRNIDHSCRLQFTAIAQFAVRSLKDWEVIMEEFTAAIKPKSLQAMYELATSDNIGFFFLSILKTIPISAASSRSLILKSSYHR